MLCVSTWLRSFRRQAKASQPSRKKEARATRTRQRKWFEHIGLDFTTIKKCVNAFDSTHLYQKDAPMITRMGNSKFISAVYDLKN